MATAEKKFEHACRELLTFNEDDINNVKDFKWHTLHKLKNSPQPNRIPKHTKERQLQCVGQSLSIYETPQQGYQ